MKKYIPDEQAHSAQYQQGDDEDLHFPLVDVLIQQRAARHGLGHGLQVSFSFLLGLFYPETCMLSSYYHVPLT